MSDVPDVPNDPPIHLCVEKHGTPYESVTNFHVPGPDYSTNPSDRMWIDWSATMATIMSTRPVQVKLLVISAYASVHGVGVERLPAEEFYARFPESDPRRSNVR